MAEESIEQALKEMLIERLFLQVTPEEIPDEANLMETLEIDSVSILEIVVGLEEVYGISFEDEEFDISIFESIKSIADYVREKTEQSET